MGFFFLIIIKRNFRKTGIWLIIINIILLRRFYTFMRLHALRLRKIRGKTQVKFLWEECINHMLNALKAPLSC